MAALTAERNTPQRTTDASLLPGKLKAAVTVFKGALVVLDAGFIAPGRTATGLIAVGRARDTYNNATGAAGAISGDFQQGIFKWGNSTAGDAIAQADVGTDCFIVDDQTVAKTNGGSTRSRAGKVVVVDADGVWVWSGLHV